MFEIKEKNKTNGLRKSNSTFILIFILSFLLIFFFIIFSSCTSSNLNSVTKINDKIYPNSFYIDVGITDSIIELNTKTTIPFSINTEKYKDSDFYEELAYNESKKLLQNESINIHYQLFVPENKPKGKFLLVHGLAGSTFTYHFLAPMLVNAGYIVIAIDLLNFGYSERIKLKLNSNCFADLIYQFLVKLEDRYSLELFNDCPSGWQIVGHSMSGRILTVFAYKYGKIIKDLILISPAFFGSRNYPILLKIPPISFFVSLYINSTLKRENFANLLKKVYLRPPEDYEIESYLKPLLIPNTIQNILYMLDTPEDPRFNPPDILRKIELPILLIWGDKDSIVPLDKSSKFIESIKNKKLIEVENAGHNSMETHVEIVFDNIMKYINR